MNKKYSDFLMAYGHEQMSKDAMRYRGPVMESFAALVKWFRQRTTCWVHYREIDHLAQHITMRRQQYNDLLERYQVLQKALDLRTNPR